MLPPPEAPQLLFAIAAFLKDGVPASDPSIQFRLRVCAGLLAAVGRGMIGGEAVESAQLAALSAALELPEPAVSDAAGRRAALAERNTLLAKALREGRFDGALDALADGLRVLLASDLQLTNPRFDLRDDIEEGP